MSLLLDALQRASKDKERAAAGGATATPPLKIKDTAPGVEYPHLQAEASTAPAPEAPLQAAPLPKELSLESSDVQRNPPAPPPQPAVTVAAAPAWEMADASTPSVTAVAPKTESAPLKLEPAPAKVAQEIRRAYVPDGKDIQPGASGNRRLIVLGGLAAILALGLGSVFLGLWGDPMQWMGGSSVSGVSPQIAPPPSAPEPVAEATAPAPAASTAAAGGAVSSSAAQAPSVTSAASAPVAFAKPVRPASGNEVVLRGDVAKTGIVSRTRGANTLEAGYAALLEGKLDAAAKAYNQALGDNPEERDALLGLAYIAHQKGQREQAQDLYRRVLRQEPGNAIAGAALLALDTDADSTITAGRARELAQQQPDSAAAVALAAGALARDGQVADAALLFARAQQLEPRNAMHAYNHAVALDRLGQYAAARLDYELALQLAQRNANAGLLTFSVDTVRQRIAQLRQSEAPKPDAAK